MFLVELGILLLCIVMGARFGGIALGTFSGTGLVVFVLIFGMPPGHPPAVLLGMILAVITALSMLEAVGGLDYLVETAQELLHRHPARITVIAPLVTYALIFAAGTQHVIYSLLPVIAEVSRKAGVRPERPLSMSVIAAQHGLIASPISAATVALIAGLTGLEAGMIDIMIVTIPATLFGVGMGILSVAWRGSSLEDDPEYQRRLSDNSVPAPGRQQPVLAGVERQRAMGSCAVFFGAVILVVMLGLFPGLRPVYESGVGSAVLTGQADMGLLIMIIMLAAGGIITLAFKASPAEAIKGKLMSGGLVAIISILGVSWLGLSFFSANEATIVGSISAMIQACPWLACSWASFCSADFS